RVPHAALAAAAAQNRGCEAMDGDPRMVGDRARQRCAFEADEIDVDALRGERVGVILHAGAASEISKNDDCGSHVGVAAGGAEAFYLRSRSFQKRASRFAATRRLYS